MPTPDKTVVRDYFERVINQQDWTASDELVDDVVDHSVSPGILPRLECSRQLAEMYFSAFPDLTVSLDDQVTEGDKIVTRWTARGTHLGDLSGGIPPAPHLVGPHRICATGRQVIISGVAIDRLSEGKITEHRGIHDSLGMIQQIGVLPTTTEKVSESPCHPTIEP